MPSQPGADLGLLPLAGGGLLFGVEPNDPLTYGVVALAVALVSLAATAAVARRAASLDPIEALLCE